MKIIDISGIKIVVSCQDYDYYWSQRNIGEDSDAFKTACRRILGLGPDDHHVDISHIRNMIWGADTRENEDCIKRILNSGLIEYEEIWCKHQQVSSLKGAAYTAMR